MCEASTPWCLGCYIMGRRTHCRRTKEKKALVTVAVYWQQEGNLEGLEPKGTTKSHRTTELKWEDYCGWQGIPSEKGEG